MNDVIYDLSNNLYTELYILMHVVEGHVVSVENESIDIPDPWNGRNYKIAGKRYLTIQNEGWWNKHKMFGKIK